MELRKLQKTGGATYVVSLPKKWVERERLDRGSLVTINEQKNGALTISAGSRKEKEIRESIIPAEGNLRRHLVEKYLLGYDVLKIKSKSKFSQKEKAAIKKYLNRLVGLEITDETSDSLTVQYLLDPEEVSILKSLRRMYTIVSVMHKDMISALENGDKNLLKDVIQRDEEVNRLYFLIVRQIRTVIQNPALQDKEGISSLDCVDYRLIAKIIEAIGDNLSAIAEKLLESGAKHKELISAAKGIYEIHKKAFEALLKKDENLATGARELRQGMRKIKTNFSNVEIANSLTKIADFGQDIADIVVCE